MKPLRTLPVSSQSGAALLILIVIIVIISMTVLLKALNYKGSKTRQNAAAISALAKAKEALIAYAVTYVDNVSGNANPGRLMCPDTVPTGTCGIGRLPLRPLSLSDQDFVSNQEFWYALNDGFRENQPVVNSSTTGSTTGLLKLDGVDKVVAIIIAPGLPLTGQNRPSNNAADYLEAGNVGGTDFVTTATGEFNDKVMAVRRSEIMSIVTGWLSGEIKKHLNTYHNINHFYPADPASFIGALTIDPLPDWVTDNNWLSVTNYMPISGDKASLKFDGCDIVYTYTFTNGETKIDRNPPHC